MSPSVCWSDREMRNALPKAGYRVAGCWDLTEFASNVHWARPECRLFYPAQKIENRRERQTRANKSQPT